MANEDLLLEPHNINDKAWWYEENRGIVVCTDNEARNDHRQILISWFQLRKALARKDK